LLLSGKGCLVLLVQTCAVLLEQSNEGRTVRYRKVVSLHVVEDAKSVVVRCIDIRSVLYEGLSGFEVVTEHGIH